MKDKILKFKSFDGYPLEGSLLSSKNEKAAILFVHGITSSRDELGFHSDFARYLAENGISSLRFDYRYHGGKDDGNTNLTELTLSGILNDIDAAFSELKKNVGEKIKSFFIIGTSFGGGLSAYWANFRASSEIKKILLNAPVIDYQDDVLDRNELTNDKGNLSEKARKQLNSKGYVESSEIHFGRGLINELKYINGINAIQDLGDKVVIFHGDEDEDVPLSSTLKYKNKDTQLEVIPNVGHGFGVEDDWDLDFPETKKIHYKIYTKALKYINSSL